MLSPEEAIERAIAQASRPFQDGLRNVVKLFFWALFIESACSLVTGRPFVRSIIIKVSDQLPAWVAVILTSIWKFAIYLAEIWQAIIRDPLISVFLDWGITIDGWLMDSAMIMLFGTSAVIRSIWHANRFKRSVRSTLKNLKDSPANLYNVDKIAGMLKGYSRKTIASDLSCVIQKMDVSVVETLHDILNLRANFYKYQAAIINTGILVNTVFGIKDMSAASDTQIAEFLRKVRNPIVWGEKLLTTEEREEAASFLGMAVPYLFRESEGRYFFKRFLHVFDGTVAQKKALMTARIQIAFVAFITGMVLLAVFIDLWSML